MTPLEKQKKIMRIMDKYFDILQKIPIGGKIDPTLAKRLKIPREFIPIIDKAFKRGKVLASNNKKMALNEIEKEVKKMGDIKNPWYDLAKEKTKTDITYQLEKTRTKVNNAVIEALKPEFNVIDEVFKDERPPEKWMATELRKITKDARQDWDMVVKSELVEKKNQGFVQAIIDNESPYTNDGLDTIIFKRPNPNACKHCKRLYLEKDGITPKLFKLSEMIANGTNYGKKVDEWKAVLGIMHPHCQCVPQVMPKGCKFDENGKIIIDKG